MNANTYYEINNKAGTHQHAVDNSDFEAMALEQYCKGAAEELAEKLSAMGQIEAIENAFAA